MIAVVIAFLVILLSAGAVMLYVAFPHRGRQPTHGAAVTDALHRAVLAVRPEDVTIPPNGLLVSPERDEEMRRRLQRWEAGVSGLPRTVGRAVRPRT